MQQGKLVLGYRMGYEQAPEDFSAVNVMVNVFGGSRSRSCFKMCGKTEPVLLLLGPPIPPKRRDDGAERRGV